MMITALLLLLLIDWNMFTLIDNSVPKNVDENNDRLDFVIEILENSEVCVNAELFGLAISQFPENDSIASYLHISRILNPDFQGISNELGHVVWTGLDSVTYLKVYSKFKNGLSQYFNSKSCIISKLLTLKIDSNDKSNLIYLANRKHGPFTSIVSKRNSDHIFLRQSDQYCSLVFIVNYCINQVYVPADLKTIFWEDLDNSTMPVEEYLELQYAKFMQIYNRYYTSDLSEFYIQVCKEFSLLLDHRTDVKSTYTIKEPYKSMNDPDLIKIQKYFNER